MTRDTRSAQTLIRELQEVVPDLEVERDDLDGLRVYRTVRLTSKERKGLEDVLSAVADDRIVNSRSITNGVEVTFTHRVNADLDHEFGIGDAADLLKVRRARRSSGSEA